MIRSVKLRRFKRFSDETFDFDGRHIVLAGPNNCGKTTVLQAIAAWAFALDRWRRLNDFRRSGAKNQPQVYADCPITRQVFSAVPLRTFELLWTDRANAQPIQIEVVSTLGWRITMEFLPDTTEQVLVRPRLDVSPQVLQSARLDAVFVPPMSGLGTAEPVYQAPKIEQLLGMCRPGEVLRNLLVAAAAEKDAWDRLTKAIRDLFNFELLPPDASGADILAEYTPLPSTNRFDIGSAGSGFQQVLMLLTFLTTRKGAVLLLDEPDAHLHVFLQEAIFDRLREAAVRSGSQLIVATHAEVVIEAVDLSELCVLVDHPIRIANEAERRRLQGALRILDNVDLMNCRLSPGVLYLEDHTDLGILRAFARVLNHPAQRVLGDHLYWKPIVSDRALGRPGVKAREHYDALQLARPGFPALELVDGDARPEIVETPMTGAGYQRLRWTRYEMESYLVHPAALDRFVERKVGAGAASAQHRADLAKHLAETYPPAFLTDPFADLPFLRNTKARTDLLPPALTAAGLPAIPYTEYFEIAEVMTPQEVHPEVKRKLDSICRAFGVDPTKPAKAKP